MKKLILPDYQNSIVNVACTIRKYFGLNYNHNTIEKIDKILEEKQPRNVVVILFDGMGFKLLKEKLPSDSFLLKHLNSEISSVVPSTTTASTTSMLSGLTPKEHGWLGWDLYFKEENKIVKAFICYGDARGDKYKDYKEIYSIYIEKNNQGKGYGSKLIKYCFDLFKKENFGRVIIRCLKGNTAEEFYHKMGGEVIDSESCTLHGTNITENIYEFILN